MSALLLSLGISDELMRKTIIAIAFLVTALGLHGQRSEEEQKIEATILAYIENFFINNYDEMEKHLHDRLAKRGIDQAGELSDDFPKSVLKELMTNKQPLPLRLQKNKVDSIFIDQKMASAVLTTGYPSVKWKEYIHLAKLKGKWIIMDVFWIFDQK